MSGRPDLSGEKVDLRRPVPDRDGRLREQWFRGDPGGVWLAFVGDEPDQDQVRRVRDELDRADLLVWTIVSKDGSPVGFIRLSWKDMPSDEASLLYYVEACHRGSGYATDAVRLVVRYGFAKRKLTKIHADVLSSNAASSRVLTRLGFASSEAKTKNVEVTLQHYTARPSEDGRG